MGHLKSQQLHGLPKGILVPTYTTIEVICRQALTMSRILMGISSFSSFMASLKISSRLLMWLASFLSRVLTSKFVSFSFSEMVLPRKPSLARSTASLPDSSAHCKPAELSRPPSKMYPSMARLPSQRQIWSCLLNLRRVFPVHVGVFASSEGLCINVRDSMTGLCTTACS